MTTISKSSPGSFCWMELGTRDQNGAKKFYGDLFGWNAEDNPMGPGEVYTIFKLKSRDAAAGYTLRKDQLAQGVPPHWMLYIASANVDASAKRAAELGATVIMQPFDVMEYGRMAVIVDPTGAQFSIWQANRSPGIGVKDEDGAFCWADLSTPDVDRATKFYSQLFGWKLEKGEKAPSGYLHIKLAEEYIGGIPPAQHRDPKAPPHWLLYFQSSDCDGSVHKAKQAGAKVYVGPQSMEEVGRWAVLGDPQGAVFAVFQSART